MILNPNISTLKILNVIFLQDVSHVVYLVYHCLVQAIGINVLQLPITLCLVLYMLQNVNNGFDAPYNTK